MSETKHTPTPWKIKRENVICDANGDLIATLGYNVCVGDDKDDCAHIVACVNAISAASEYSVRNGGNPLKDPSDLVQWTESTFALHSEMRRQQDRAEGLAAENARLREALGLCMATIERDRRVFDEVSKGKAGAIEMVEHARQPDPNGDELTIARAALASTEGK